MMFKYSSHLLGTSFNTFTVCQQCPISISTYRSGATRTYYEILEVPETATKAEIKNAFIKKSKEFHPDVNPDDPLLHKAFIKVSEAYTTLSCSSLRRQYDNKLNGVYPSTNAVPRSYSSGSPFGHNRGENYHYYQNASQSRQKASGFARPHSVPNPYNNKVIIGTLLFMLTGAVVHFTILSLRHKKYQEHVEMTTKQAHKAYNEAKERARTNTLKEQLELLTAHHAFYAQAGKGSPKTENPERVSK